MKKAMLFLVATLSLSALSSADQPKIPYSEYSGIQDVVGTQDFAGRWKEVCSAPADEETPQAKCARPQLAAAGSKLDEAAWDQQDLAGAQVRETQSYLQGYRTASDWYKRLKEDAWSSKNFKKALQFKIASVVPDFGTGRDTRLTVREAIYLYLGPDKQEALLGTKSLSDRPLGKLTFLQGLEKNPPVIDQSKMDAYLSPQAQARLQQSGRLKKNLKLASDSAKDLAKKLNDTSKTTETLFPVAAKPAEAQQSQPEAVAQTTFKAVLPLDAKPCSDYAFKSVSKHLPPGSSWKSLNGFSQRAVCSCAESDYSCSSAERQQGYAVLDQLVMIPVPAESGTAQPAQPEAQAKNQDMAACIKAFDKAAAEQILGCIRNFDGDLAAGLAGTGAQPHGLTGPSTKSLLIADAALAGKTESADVALRTAIEKELADRVQYAGQHPRSQFPRGIKELKDYLGSHPELKKDFKDPAAWTCIFDGACNGSAGPAGAKGPVQVGGQKDTASGSGADPKEISACKQFLDGQQQASDGCKDHPTMSLIWGGVKSAAKDQVSWVAVATMVATILLGFLSGGIGLLAKIAQVLLTLAKWATIVMVGALIKQAFTAGKAFFASEKGSDEHAKAVYDLSRIFTTLAILGLLAGVSKVVGKGGGAKVEEPAGKPQQMELFSKAPRPAGQTPAAAKYVFQVGENGGQPVLESRPLSSAPKLESGKVWMKNDQGVFAQTDKMPFMKGSAKFYEAAGNPGPNNVKIYRPFQEPAAGAANPTPAAAAGHEGQMRLFPEPPAEKPVAPAPAVRPAPAASQKFWFQTGTRNGKPFLVQRSLNSAPELKPDQVWFKSADGSFKQMPRLPYMKAGDQFYENVAAPGPGNVIDIRPVRVSDPVPAQK